jgi:amino acid adenylation domain-containing protein
MIRKQNIEDILKLSPMQENIYFNSLLSPGSRAYHEQTLFYLDRVLEGKALNDSVQIMVARNTILRTAFQMVPGHGLLQIVLKSSPVDVTFYNFSDDSDWQESILRLKEDDFRDSFDLGNPSLLRVRVIELPKGCNVLFMSHHHILLDGWSLALMIQQLFSTYKALVSRLERVEGAVNAYGAYVNWIVAQDKLQAKKFWSTYLEGYRKGQSWLWNKRAHLGYEQAKWITTIAAGDYKGIQAYCRSLGVTLNTYFKVAWGLVIQHFTGSSDIIIGTVVTHRPSHIPGIDSMLGLFINTLPSRIQLRETESISDALFRFQNEDKNTLPHQYYPTSEIQALSIARNQLIDHLLVVENYELNIKEPDTISEEWPSITKVEVEGQTSYDLNVIVVPKAELNAKIEFNALAFEPRLVAMIGEVFRQRLVTLKGLSNAPMSSVMTNAPASVTDQPVDGRSTQAFWLNQFEGELTPLDLPYDFPSQLNGIYLSSSVKFDIERAETAQLQRLAETHIVELNTVLLSLFKILLSKISGQQDIIVGVVLPETAGSGEIPVRSYPMGKLSFKEFLFDIKETVFKCLAHHPFPEDELANVLASSKGRGDRVRSLFDARFEFGDQCSNVMNESALQKMQGQLSLSVLPRNGYLSCSLAYAPELFTRMTAIRITESLAPIISAVVRDSEIALSALSALTAKDRSRILQEFNATNCDFAHEATLVSVFQNQVSQTPEAPAIFYGLTCFSYRALDERSDQLAVFLEAKGVGAGDLIGVALKREADLLSTLFGILKCGAAYVPIDPDYPQDRVQSIIDDARLKAIVHRGLGVTLLKNFKGLSVDISSIDWDGKKNHSLRTYDSRSLAYVIYTSGSSGKPKGVMIEHRSVINRIAWMQKEYPLRPEDVLLQKTPIVFDVSVWELFWWSFSGAALCVLAPAEEKDPEAIVASIEKHHVTAVHFVPSMLNAFMAYTAKGFNWSRLKSLRQVFASGESLKLEQTKLFAKGISASCGTRLINLYGPTEATVDVSYYECNFTEKYVIPIGRPIDNISLYIVDSGDGLCPIGVRGELAIGGVGVGRGYLNNPILTKEKFVNLKGIEGTIYRTGDFARWLDDGNVEYMGRIDDQVKIRGHRIEIGDIEHHLSDIPNVQQCAVVLREDSNEKFLVAYYSAEAALQENALKNQMLQCIPDYMVPRHFIYLPMLPLSGNGKLNRRALLELQLPSMPTSNGKSDLKVTTTERVLMNAWSSVLEREIYSTEENFFEVGGTSIKLISLLLLIKEKFTDTSITVPSLYSNPTIRRQATLIDGTDLKTSHESVKVFDF